MIVAADRDDADQSGKPVWSDGAADNGPQPPRVGVAYEC